MLGTISAGPGPHPLMILPFVAMLSSIAFAPLVIRHHWERHYHEVAVGLGAIPVLYYLLILKQAAQVAHMLHEYLSFIALVGSLFVVAGGIHLSVRRGSGPVRNTLFLALGALASNLIGTTGAGILLIRPWLRMNGHRHRAFHTVFFILLVANVGGMLTPIANPPLFLGFIKGVPFWWVARHCWKAWAVVNTALLAMFLCLDLATHRRAPALPAEEEPGAFGMRGGWNLALFVVVVGSLFIKGPPFLREGLMAAAAVVSYKTTARPIHQANDFTFAPIIEISWLFAGVFATMLPALGYLQLHAQGLGIRSPMQFYWLSGGLSAILDNAPTYLAFAATAFGLQGMSLGNPADVARFINNDAPHLAAISIGSVLFGAITYLGNGPNLMIKGIAEAAGAPTPGFTAYMAKYSIPVLLPLLALVAWLFLRG